MNRSDSQLSLGPVEVQLEAGKQYYLCTCGQSRKRPFCDGSHAGSGHEPHVFTAEASKAAYLCTCTRSANKPFCDGRHNNA